MATPSACVPIRCSRSPISDLSYLSASYWSSIKASSPWIKWGFADLNRQDEFWFTRRDANQIKRKYLARARFVPPQAAKTENQPLLRGWQPAEPCRLRISAAESGSN